MRMRVSVVLGFAALALAAAPPSEEAQKEIDRLQGVWRITSMTAEGAEVPMGSIRGETLTIKKTQFTWTHGGGANIGVFEIDPRVTPHWINIGFTAGERQGELIPGIYKFNGNNLILSLGTGGGRPSDFSSRQGQVVQTFVHTSR